MTLRLKPGAISCYVVAGAAALIGWAVADASPRCPNLLFATGFDGAAEGGSKAALIDAVQRGEPIRLGWELDFDKNGSGELSHWADAGFLSVWEGEVFAQIDAIHGQRPVRGENDIRFPDEYVEWRGSLGTTGKLEGAYSDGRKLPDLTARIVWCAARAQQPVWTALYKNGLNGETLAGSKEDLFAAIRAGQPIQIAWGVGFGRDEQRRSVEHLVAPVFVTIVNDADVVAQLPEHVAQRSYTDIDEAFFDDGAVMWRGVMSTKGTFDAIWVNRGSGEVIRRLPQRVVLTWYARQKAPASTPSLAIDRGVTLDEKRAGETLKR